MSAYKPEPFTWPNFCRAAIRDGLAVWAAITVTPPLNSIANFIVYVCVCAVLIGAVEWAADRDR